MTILRSALVCLWQFVKVLHVEYYLRVRPRFLECFSVTLFKYFSFHHKSVAISSTEQRCKQRSRACNPELPINRFEEFPRGLPPRVVAVPKLLHRMQQLPQPFAVLPQIRSNRRVVQYGYGFARPGLVKSHFRNLIANLERFIQ